MKPLNTLVAALALLTVLPGLAPAEVIRQPVTFANDAGGGELFMKNDLDEVTAGIILVHEWWGLDQYVRDRARMLAREGYVAFAVDMYGQGRMASHPSNARALAEEVLAHPDKLKARFDAAKSLLRDQQYVEDARIFAIGYGFGGRVVLNLARRGEDLVGVAVFHGKLATDQPMQPGAFDGRVFIATGLDDPLVPREQIRAVVGELSSAGVPLELLTFPGARHAFTNPKAEKYGRRFDLPLAYDAVADRTSWSALLNFLAQTPVPSSAATELPPKQ